MIRSFDHAALEEGEGVTVEAEEGSVGESRSEESDAMAEQECLFGANAMPNKPVCKVFEATATPGARITSMAWGAERRGGERVIRYYSSSAGDAPITVGTCWARVWQIRCFLTELRNVSFNR